jgi:hypothetical protein
MTYDYAVSFVCFLYIILRLKCSVWSQVPYLDSNRIKIQFVIMSDMFSKFYAHMWIEC